MRELTILEGTNPQQMIGPQDIIKIITELAFGKIIGDNIPMTSDRNVIVASVKDDAIKFKLWCLRLYALVLATIIVWMIPKQSRVAFTIFLVVLVAIAFIQSQQKANEKERVV